MCTRKARWNVVLSALFVVAMGACGGSGGCGGCAAVQPLPGGKLPADQTVEGGAQIRLTQQGFGKLTSILPGLVNQGLATGFCVPGDSVIGIDYCKRDQGQCHQGCRIVPTLNSMTANVVSGNQTLHLHVDARAATGVPLDVPVFGECTLSIAIDHLIADADVVFGVDGATGELTVHASAINQFRLDGRHFDGCSIGSDLLSVATAIFNSAIGQFVVGLLTPAIDDLIQGFLPHPLGLAGVMNVGSLLAGLSSTGGAMLETRLVPGGYVHLNGSGMSLGVITGLNADRDPSTRTAALSSEPALCVPPLARPNLGAAPRSLPATTRGTYLLDAANAFNGAPDPATDLALGISQTTLDLAGHHLMASGALCLEVGTSLVKQLNLATIGLFVRSLGQLASETHNDPVLLVTRPQRALDLTIGDNTASSPALTVGIQHLEVDFYAFVYERYVRAFTLDLTLNAGVNLEFEQAAGQPAKIRPTLVGIDASHVKLKVLNSEFVKEAPADLEAVLPSVFNLVTPLLGNLPEITVPAFAGFSLENLSIKHVTTSQDDFLAVYASLGASSLMRQVAGREPLMASAVTAMDAAQPAAQAPSTGRARLVRVTTPDIDRVRGALLHEAGGAMPEVTFDVDSSDAAGRELEWSYQLDGGLWRPWREGAPLVIRDPAFAWQGKYMIGLASRVKGDYHTVSDATEVPVIIDSVAPRVAVDQAAWSGDTYRIPAFDIVSGHALRYGFGAPGDAAPRSAWTAGGTIELSRDAAAEYLDEHGQLAVFVQDEAGNTSVTLVAPFGSQSGGCSAGGASGAGGLLVLVAGLLLRRRPSQRFPRSNPARCDERRAARGNLAGRRDERRAARWEATRCDERRAARGNPAGRCDEPAARWEATRCDERFAPRGNPAGRCDEPAARWEATRCDKRFTPRGNAAAGARGSVRRVAAGAAVWVGVALGSSLLPACNCGSAARAACESMDDCSENECEKGALPFCVDHMCMCSSDIVPGRIGPYSRVAVGADGAIWVSAYAESHGDLVVARTTGGRIADDAWEWVDGVPDGPVLIPGAKIRGGIDENGPDVGMYTSIAVGPDGVPMVSYYDRDTGSLKLAQRIGGKWQIHVVDRGTGRLPATGTGALVGMYTSLTLRGDDGRPGIAYLAHVADSAGRRAEVRFASAQVAHPFAAIDWQFSVVDTAALPPDDPANPSLFPLPQGLGLFIDSARLPSQAPVVAYYDRAAGDLKVSRFDVPSGRFAAARVLDGSGGVDAGWSPSVAVDAQGVVNVAYVGTTASDLKFVSDAPGAVPEVVDDGYRIDGMTADGLPRPVFHFVGADAGLVLSPGGPLVVYQDATTQELLLAQKQAGTWSHVSIAGATTPGGYGFYAAGALGKGQLVMSSWVVDLPADDYNDTSWVEVFTRPLGP